MKMTEKNINSVGKIYTIRCYDKPDFLYIGSTFYDLDKRFSSHLSNARRKKHIKLYKAMSDDFNIIDFWYIELYEQYENISKQDLHNREREIIHALKPSLNTQFWRVLN